MDKVNLDDIDSRALELANKFGYKSLWGLDKKRLYVLLAEKDGRQVVIKTSHVDDEVALLKLLGKNESFEKNGIIVPKLYEYSDEYLIQDYIPGKYLDIFDFGFLRNLRLILSKLNYFQGYLNKNPEFTGFTKGIDDNLSKNLFKNNEWLKKRILGWFSDGQSKKKYRFKENDMKEVLRLFKGIAGETVIQFGAFSPAHIRIIGNKIGVFDFGHHIRWAPSEYDRAYLFWGLLCERKLQNNSSDFWLDLAKELSESAKETKLFWACVIERLAGIAKDLTVGDQYENDDIKNNLLTIRKKVLNFAINILKENNE